MSATEQVITQVGIYFGTDIPGGQRARIDPDLKDQDGNALQADEITTMGPCRVVGRGSAVDGNGRTYYYFDLQSNATHPDQIMAYTAKYNHSIQNKHIEQLPNTYGPTGENPSPTASKPLRNGVSFNKPSGDFTAEEVNNGQIAYGDSTLGGYTSNLIADPVGGELIHLKNAGTANTWTIGGNGKDIEGLASLGLGAGQSVSLHYTPDHEWKRVRF